MSFLNLFLPTFPSGIQNLTESLHIVDAQWLFVDCHILTFEQGLLTLIKITRGVLKCWGPSFIPSEEKKTEMGISMQEVCEGILLESLQKKGEGKKQD